MRKLKPVYVWELPVRIYHWVNALCMVLLFATGIYIGTPFLRPTVVTGDATTVFWMGDAIAVHMAVAYLFTANYLFRIYWAFVGNEYARTHHWPWQKAYWGEFRDTLLHYLFIKKDEPHHLGHNPLANLAYFFFIMVGSAFMAVTGFAMYGELHPDGFMFSHFGWIIPLLGSSFEVHMLHRLGAWLMVSFIFVHLYMVIRHDVFARNGTMSSIFSGYKFDVEK
ncbi:Ni/Fe-hydrogenase, b-type cytochrome subunit [Heliorestis convoluta]|uniref:Ni/fe-hydrogenase, b-type cytochrome subunit n=1 Tax=Heliorestis convoluta TaxID=356322 RepID=A0A5Q2N0E8_9FIRM|nr:Ni/Fe-hydrogenase, b-type cytochrome subunit [Heliorestis convoluta]QGG48468.1 Ni/fe-hydrogenase, b-type cytochrome subunit [Heliorestis convoluta]